MKLFTNPGVSSVVIMLTLLQRLPLLDECKPKMKTYMVICPSVTPNLKQAHMFLMTRDLISHKMGKINLTLKEENVYTAIMSNDSSNYHVVWK